jgi:8-oxo-dGTP pyrophosphatase MutT (NUDIX family)
MSNGVRPVAICVFRHADRILVARGYDAVKGEHFMRPLGGRIEFGELAAEALRREIREELNAEIHEPELLGVLEDVYVYAGGLCHDVAFVFDAKFRDASLYDKVEIPIAEDWDGPATWQHLSKCGTVAVPLYPTGLQALLLAHASDPSPQCV